MSKSRLRHDSHKTGGQTRFDLSTFRSAVVVGICLGLGFSSPLAEAKRLTPRSEYTFGIEGPAVDREGALFVVNFKEQGTIGRVAPGAEKSELYLKLPEGSVSSSIRFDREGRMFIADYKKHNIYVIEKGSKEPRVYFHDERMNQPNDFTIAPDGTIFASDPSWKKKSGQLWAIRRGKDGRGEGQLLESPRALGTTNGIDVSPDGRTLYVSESRDVWAYQISGSGSGGFPKLENAKRLIQFPDGELDGLRTDVDGQIYVARILKGTIAILHPDGKLEKEIAVEGNEPNNLAFGGPDGKTVFVTQRQGGYVESFRVDRPGREFHLQHDGGESAGNATLDPAAKPASRPTRASP